MRYHTVFWDFNGTVADDMALSIRCINTMLQKRDLPQLTTWDAYRQVFGFPVRDYYERVGLFSLGESYEALAAEWIELYLAGESEMVVQPGFFLVHDALRAGGVKQFILSSSETGMLQREIAMLGLQNAFDGIYGMDNYYAGGKIAMARRYIGDSAPGTVLIGDTPHDADTAAAIGADCILFAGGHGYRPQLEKRHVPVAETMEECLTHLL